MTRAAQGKTRPSRQACQWRIYMLRCSDGTYYTGMTNRLARRLQLHAAGRGAKYLRGRLPFTLVYQRVYRSPRAARQAEWRIKQLSRAQKDTLISCRA